MGQLKSALYARMEEMSFRSGAPAAARVTGARLLLAVAHPAAQPDDGPRDRGPGLPAAVSGPGVRGPACRADAGHHPHPASSGSAYPAASRGAARLVGLAPVATAVAVALGRVTASPPPIAGPAGFVVLDPRG